jgi:hypothetical protein
MEQASDIERALLESASDDAPSPQARARTLDALGLGGPPPASGSGFKWIGLATVGVGLLVGGGVLLGRGAREPSLLATTGPAPHVFVPHVEPAPAPPEPASVTPPAATPSARPTASAPPPKRDAGEEPNLAAEVAALDRARVALAAGDAARAVRELDQYQKDFPRGILGQEALVLRIEALVRSGNAAAARALADRFLRASPGSPHAARIRTLVGGPAGDP